MIEGESELSRNKHRTIYQLPIVYLHTGAMTRDLAVEQCPTQKDLHSSNCLQDTTVTCLKHDQNATSDFHHHCTVSELFLKLLNANLPKITNSFLYQVTVSQTRKLHPNIYKLSQNSCNGYTFWWSRRYLYGKP